MMRARLYQLLFITSALECLQLVGLSSAWFWLCFLWLMILERFLEIRSWLYFIKYPIIIDIAIVMIIIIDFILIC
jgi:hypothetical protein